MNPFASSRSLTPIGIPASIPTSSFFIIAESICSACKRASSGFMEQKAFNSPSNFSILSKADCVNSLADIFFP